MSDRDDLAETIKRVSDRWDEPLDEVHDIPQIADAILAAGWRPPARKIETVEELKALPEGSIVRDSCGINLTKDYESWYMPRTDDPDDVSLPTTVLWEPVDETGPTKPSIPDAVQYVWASVENVRCRILWTRIGPDKWRCVVSLQQGRRGYTGETADRSTDELINPKPAIELSDELRCPVCGSDEISMNVISEALGIISYRCDVCGRIKNA